MSGKIFRRARCPYRVGEKRKMVIANLKTICRGRCLHRPVAVCRVYKEYVNIEGRDQYGQSLKLENETYQIVENSTNKVSMATYDPATDRMVFDASGSTFSIV